MSPKNTRQKRYSFNSPIWRYKSHAGWYFVTLPKPLSKTLRKLHGSSEEGWGRLRVEAAVGKSKWKTAIWYDTKLSSYLLPIKFAIRKANQIDEGKILSVKLTIDIGAFGF